MDDEEINRLTDEVANANLATAKAVIEHNITVIGKLRALEVSTIVTMKTFSLIIGHIANLNKEERQFFYDKLAEFTTETVTSIKNAPSEN